MARPRVATLDDDQGVALACADWSEVEAVADVTVFRDHIGTEDALAERLAPFEILCVMRERTALPGSLLERLTRLRLIASTGPSTRPSIRRRPNGSASTSCIPDTLRRLTIELAWALILASQRRLVDESASLRAGGWQQHLGGAARSSYSPC